MVYKFLYLTKFKSTSILSLRSLLTILSMFVQYILIIIPCVIVVIFANKLRSRSKYCICLLCLFYGSKNRINIGTKISHAKLREVKLDTKLQINDSNERKQIWRKKYWNFVDQHNLYFHSPIFPYFYFKNILYICSC